MKAWIYLENGLFLEGESFGASGTVTGEIVFNTALSGYQEIVTDPSYAGQFVTFTLPEIGVVGANEDDMESRGVFCSGILVRHYNDYPSSFRSEKTLGKLLQEHGKIGVSGIDTRLLVKTVREEGAMMMIASTEISDKEELKAKLDQAPRIEEIDYIQTVSTSASYVHENACWNPIAMGYNLKNTSKKIAAIDFGVKRNILNELTEVGFDVEVLPASFDAEKLISRHQKGEIGGIFLSNGPGDPLVLTDAKEKIKQLIDAKVPMFGICLGHQLLSIAHGYDTHKLKFGHHGGNHPVRSLDGQVMITSQNHNYSVPDNITEIADVTHVNLFDQTIEGIRYKDSPIFSYQHHPEASPGPKESRSVFEEFFRFCS